jgi:hypothetical protein
MRRGVGVTGQVMERREPVQIRDIAVSGADENPIRRRLIEVGHHALLAVPLVTTEPSRYTRLTSPLSRSC